jgi:hypothetical protein
MLLQVKQRDSEIAIMIGMVKGKSNSIAQVSPTAVATGTAAAAAVGGAPAASSAAAAAGSSSDSGQVLSALLDARLLADRHAAFEVFRKSYRQGEVSPSLLETAGTCCDWLCSIMDQTSAARRMSNAAAVYVTCSSNAHSCCHCHNPGD